MIIFLYGPDSFRRYKKLQELKDRFIKEVDTSGQSVAVIDGATTTLKEIDEKVSTGSLFVKRRLIIIRDLLNNKNQQLFAELLRLIPSWDKGAPEEQNIIVFDEGEIASTKLSTEKKALITFLKKQPFTQEFKTLSVLKAADFARQEVEFLGRKIDAKAAHELASRTANDLWLLNSELHKLAMSLALGESITLELIKEQIDDQYEQDIFALTDAVAAKDNKRALALLEEQFLAGLSEDYILAMMIRQFKILLQVQGASTPNDLAKELGLHPFVLKKGLAQAKNFSKEELHRIFDRLIDLDWQNKSSKIHLPAELSLLISRL